MRVLVDTCVFLNVLYSEKGCEKVGRFLKNIKHPVISVITLSEILASAYKKAEWEAVEAKVLIEKAVGSENVILVTKDIAELAGKLKSKYSPKFSLADAIILATALLTGCRVVATMDSEFDKVEEVQIVNPLK